MGPGATWSGLREQIEKGGLLGELRKMIHTCNVQNIFPDFDVYIRSLESTLTLKRHMWCKGFCLLYVIGPKSCLYLFLSATNALFVIIHSIDILWMHIL